MCDNCSENHQELENIELDDREVAIASLCVIGGLVEAYCQSEYADPLLYSASEVAEKLARKLGEIALAERLATVKIYAGETVNKMIDEHEMPISKESWS
jgi:hypothetical protein